MDHIDDEEMASCTWKIGGMKLPITSQLQNRFEVVNNMVGKGRTLQESLQRVFGNAYKKDKKLILLISEYFSIEISE